MDKPHRWSTVGNFDVHLQDFSHLQSTMRGSEVTSTSRALEFRDRLTSSGRDVDERLEDLGKAIQWVAEQLVRIISLISDIVDPSTRGLFV